MKETGETFNPAELTRPTDRCELKECKHFAMFHEWEDVPKAELASPYEKSARRVVCSRCRATKRGYIGCALVAETTF